MGETKPTLRERFKEHRQATNNPLTPRKRHSSSPFPLYINLATRSQT